MSFDIQRFVSGCGPDGKAVVDANEKVEPIVLQGMPGVEYFQIWGSNEPPVVGAGTWNAEFAPYFPPPGGVRFMLLRWPPDSTPAPEGDPTELATEVESVFPGLLAAVRSDEAGMHATDSVDMTVILSGELWLELDDGTETRVTAGSCVVQRGTRHTWHNRSTEHAVMACVFVGAERVAA